MRLDDTALLRASAPPADVSHGAPQLGGSVGPDSFGAAPCDPPEASWRGFDPAAAFDLVVVGSGPAGQAAALEGAAAGARVLMVERERRVGGACVQRGTIPSKTLREAAAALKAFGRRTGGVYEVVAPAHLRIESLLTRLHGVLDGYQDSLAARLRLAGVEICQGRARLGPSGARHTVELLLPDGATRVVTGTSVVLSSGSRPRNPSDVPIDHENVLDSDSILTLSYLPESLVVLGAGVIACEYATTFAALGVRVTVVDKGAMPLGFCDADVSRRLVDSLDALGASYRGGRRAASVEFDGLEVVTTLDDGQVLRSEKLLFALGRESCVDGLGLEQADVRLGSRGTIEADAWGATSVPGIYACGDVVGPPALATTSAEQGRRAALHALGLAGPEAPGFESVPVGIYTIPEIGQVGLTEAEARARHGDVLVGWARYDECARGHIAGGEPGFLKLVAAGERLVGVHAVGEGAAELVHIGQLAMAAGWSTDRLIDTVFNFPTLAEGYRIAAMDLRRQRVPRRILSVCAGSQR